MPLAHPTECRRGDLLQPASSRGSPPTAAATFALFAEGRSRRRRLPERLDQPRPPRDHRPRQRPGGNDHRQRRRHRGAPGTTSQRPSSTTSTADNAFPYRVYSGQQESGSGSCIASRGDRRPDHRRATGDPVGGGRVRLRRARSASTPTSSYTAAASRRYDFDRTGTGLESSAHASAAAASGPDIFRQVRTHAGRVLDRLIRTGSLLRQQLPVEDDRRRHATGSSLSDGPDPRDELGAARASIGKYQKR